MRGLSLLIAIAVPVWAQFPAHPLDALTTAEYWTVYDTLNAAGHVTPDTMFAGVLLHPPAKSAVLSWQPGQPFSREAGVTLLRGNQSFSARVDISGKKVAKFDELKGAQAPFLTSEVFGADEFIKKDPRVVEALGKRGITDLRMVECLALPVAYRAIPEQATQRIGFGFCSQTHRVYHSYGRSIEGLTFQIDMVAKKILKIVDTEVVPVPTGDANYEEIPENPRPHTTPIVTSQPMGPGYRIENGEIAWQNWRFRIRLDPRVGTVLNLVRFVDQGRPRPVLYEGSLSEIFVPYMDPAPGWNSRVFIDAGGAFAAAGHLKPMRPGLDCPAGAAWFDGLWAGETGAPKVSSNMACLFERNLENPAWRHAEGGEVNGRPPGSSCSVPPP